MINLFDFEGGRPLSRQAVKIAPRIKALRAACDRRGHPVVYVNDNFMDWNHDFQHLLKKCTEQTGPSMEIARSLGPSRKHHYILKPRHSAFLCTALPAILKDLEAEHLILTGISTDSCIAATAIDAHMRSYGVTVPIDCVAAQTAYRSKRALALLKSSMGIDTQSSQQLMRNKLIFK
jgi:nicotinamidase-related amidase